MANIELARKALDYIDRYPDQHDQGDWCRASDKAGNAVDYGTEFPAAVDNGDHPPCGTSFCLAGWVAFLTAPTGTTFIAGRASLYGKNALGYLGGISEFAQDKLDLDNSQANALFHGENTRHALGVMVDLLEANPEVSGRELKEAAGTPVCSCGCDEN